MFCRFGFSLEIRPVVVAIWLNVAWMRPSAPDQRRQRVGVGAAELLDLAVPQQVVEDRVRLGGRHLLERVGVGRRAGLRALDRRELELLEEDPPELRHRVHDERLARVRVDLALEVVALVLEVGAQLLEELAVDADAGVLHLARARARAAARPARRGP